MIDGDKDMMQRLPTGLREQNDVIRKWLWSSNPASISLTYPTFLPQNGFPNIVRHLSGTLDVAVYSRLCLQGEIATGIGDINLQDKCIQQLSLLF